MGWSSRVECCTTKELLEEVIASAAAVVQLRALPVASMFPPDLKAALGQVPYEVVCAVAPPEVAAEIRIERPRLGQALVFARRQLLGRVESGLDDRGQNLIGLLRAGLSPWLGQSGSTRWGDDDADPFEVIGVTRSATFDEVRAAWRRKLSEYHPDRYAKAGEKIRQVAAEEAQRINAAFTAIQRIRTRAGA